MATQEQLRQEEREWAERAWAYCVAVETAPKPSVKPRALIVIREDGAVFVKHRGTDGVWHSERVSLANAYERQAELIRGMNG